jgi:hypothetical protein
MNMKTIWKFPLAEVSPYQITMPKEAEILTVQRQGGSACIWAIVNPDADKERRVFEVFGTGQPMHGDMGVERKYVNTFQQGPYVWHVFERVN